MKSFDVRNLTEAKRLNLARQIQTLGDIKLPHLSHWNYDLCRKHRNGWDETYLDDNGVAQVQRITHRPPKWCRKCGIHPARHQRLSILWLYYKKHALLADLMGSGKTISAGGLIAMLLETGELPQLGRAIITPRSPALYQWRTELSRMMPGLKIVVAEGSQAKRIEKYAGDWDVLLIGPEMLLRDYQHLSKVRLSAFITDDVDYLRNPDTQSSRILDTLGSAADRYVIMTGTPLQKRLPELHAVLDAIGGQELFGDIKSFMRRYVRYNTVETLDRSGQIRQVAQIVGYRNLAEMKRLISPLVMRRTAADFDSDLEMPDIMPNDVYLDLYPAQRAKYKELQKGVITLLKETGETTVKHTTALSKIHYGAAICAGMVALGEDDRPLSSVKLDWIMRVLGEGGELEGEKVVIFANLKVVVEALQYRLRDAGIGFVTVWGKDNSKKRRQEAQEKFWEDPNCRVLIGTRAIEQSLNLQVARHLINVDLILNPARMAQLAGRVKRTGSKFKTVYVHNLIAAHTQEERYLALLEREAALSSFVWDESSELFKALTGRELMQLISG